MLDEMRKKGKPIDPKMEKMAAWLDSLARDAGDMGDVRLAKAPRLRTARDLDRRLAVRKLG